MEDYTRINLKDIKDPISDIQFEGEIFQEEKTITKNDRMIQTMAIYDGTDAMIMKRFEGRGITREILSSYGEGNYVRVYGSIQFDNFAKDLVIMPQEIEVLENQKKKIRRKRRELNSICIPI